MRLVSRDTAAAMRHRVTTHVPSHEQFIRELELVKTFNQRGTKGGVEAYHRAFLKIFWRFGEVRKPCGCKSDYRRALVRFMGEPECQRLPPAFDGFIARLHHASVRSEPSLLDQFTRIRTEGPRGDGDAYVSRDLL